MKQKLASIDERSKAFSIDMLFGFVVPSVAFTVLDEALFADSGPLLSLAVCVGTVIGIILPYWIIIPYWTNGFSLGKWLLGIRIVRTDGQPLTLRRAALRFVLYARSASRLLNSFGDRSRWCELLTSHDDGAQTQVVQIDKSRNL